MEGNGLYKDETKNKSKDRERRVLVGKSGGIDSSAVCMLLQEQAYRNSTKDAHIYLINMPTGSGKTLASAKIALQRAIAKKKKRII